MTDGGEKPAKKRAKKDPNAPKRANTSFILFSKEYRNKVLEEDPSLSVVDVSKKLGVLWKEVSSEEKKV